MYISSVIGEMSMSKLCEIQYGDQAPEPEWVSTAKSHVNSIHQGVVQITVHASRVSRVEEVAFRAPHWIGKQIKTVAGKIRAIGKRLAPEGYQDATGFHPLK
jgi:hypothetical protein